MHTNRWMHASLQKLSVTPPATYSEANSLLANHSPRDICLSAILLTSHTYLVGGFDSSQVLCSSIRSDHPKNVWLKKNANLNHQPVNSWLVIMSTPKGWWSSIYCLMSPSIKGITITASCWGSHPTTGPYSCRFSPCATAVGLQLLLLVVLGHESMMRTTGNDQTAQPPRIGSWCATSGFSYVLHEKGMDHHQLVNDSWLKRILTSKKLTN